MPYDETPAPTRRAPEFNEHGDEILTELDLDMDRDHRPPHPRGGRLRVRRLI
ncbi:MAG: hypothetical protein WKF43_02040 [Acidimicrobiales bacterium]